MKSRLVRMRSEVGRAYAVVFRGKRVGEVWRKGHDKTSVYGYVPWQACAYLRNNDVVHHEWYLFVVERHGAGC